MPYILLIEDNKTHALLLSRSLRRIPQSPSLQHIMDGKIALNLLNERAAASTLPALVLLDLRLSGMSGFEVLETIKKTPELRAIPVVILSSSNREVDIQLAKDCGATDFWTKPVSTEELAQRLGAMSLIKG